MQASKSTAHATNFDTFHCLTCDTTIVEQPARTGNKPAIRTGDR